MPSDTYAEHWIQMKGFDPKQLREFKNGQSVWHMAAVMGRIDILEWLVSKSQSQSQSKSKSWSQIRGLVPHATRTSSRLRLRATAHAPRALPALCPRSAGAGLL